MTWRDRLALWCLRVLVPHGINGNNVPTMLSFGSGRSTPDDPKLVVTVRPADHEQTIVALVFDPDTVADDFANAVHGLRAWAAEQGRPS